MSHRKQLAVVKLSPVLCCPWSISHRNKGGPWCEQLGWTDGTMKSVHIWGRSVGFKPITNICVAYAQGKKVSLGTREKQRNPHCRQFKIKNVKNELCWVVLALNFYYFTSRVKRVQITEHGNRHIRISGRPLDICFAPYSNFTITMICSWNHEKAAVDHN